MADYSKITINQISQLSNNFNIKEISQQLQIKESYVEILLLYSQGIGSSHIGQKIGMHPNSVLKVLKKFNVNCRGPQRKITEDQEKEIIKSFQNDDLSITELAKQFNTTNLTIRKYLKNNNIEPPEYDDARRKHPINKHYFDQIDTPDKAYILGFIAADGGIIGDRSESDERGKVLSFTVEWSDKDILEKIASYLYLENPSDQVKYHNRNKKRVDGSNIEEAYLHIRSVYLVEQLNKLGIEKRKSLTIKFPDFLKNSDLVRHFIHGYYDGDGGISLHKSANKDKCFVSLVGTKDYMSNIMLIILKNLELKFFLRQEYEKNVWRIYLQGHFNCLKLLNWFYQDAPLYLNRKYKLYEQLKEKCEEIKSNLGKPGYYYSIIDSSFRLFKSKQDLSKEDIDNIILLYQNNPGITYTQIQNKLGIYRKDISKIIKGQNSVDNKKYLLLSNNDKNEIIRAYINGVKISDIAEKYSINFYYINKIIKSFK